MIRMQSLSTQTVWREEIVSDADSLLHHVRRPQVTASLGLGSLSKGLARNGVNVAYCTLYHARDSRVPSSAKSCLYPKVLG